MDKYGVTSPTVKWWFRCAEPNHAACCFLHYYCDFGRLDGQLFARSPARLDPHNSAPRLIYISFPSPFYAQSDAPTFVGRFGVAALQGSSPALRQHPPNVAAPIACSPADHSRCCRLSPACRDGGTRDRGGRCLRSAIVVHADGLARHSPPTVAS